MHAYNADIDECEEDIDGCEQECTDTDGSYNCSCSLGYTLVIDEHGCDGECYNNNNNLIYVQFYTPCAWSCIEFTVKI